MLKRTYPCYSCCFLKSLHFIILTTIISTYSLHQKLVGTTPFLMNGQRGSGRPPAPAPLFTPLPPCLPPSSHPLCHPVLSPASPKTNDGDDIDLSVQERESNKCTCRPLSKARSQPFANAVERSLRPLIRQ